MPRGREPAAMQKLPLTAAETRDVLRLTLAIMVDPVSINTDQKRFYQLAETETLKTRRGGISRKKTKQNKPTTKTPKTHNKKPHTKTQNQLPPPKSHTSKKEKGQAEACMLFLFMLNIHKPQCWAVGHLRTLLRKQAGWKLKAEQLFLSNSQHRQVVNCKQQTTCPVH